MNTLSIMLRRPSDANKINTIVFLKMIAFTLTDSALKATFKWWPLAPETWSLVPTELTWDKLQRICAIVIVGAILLNYSMESSNWEPVRAHLSRRDGIEGLYPMEEVVHGYTLVLLVLQGTKTTLDSFYMHRHKWRRECCGCRWE